MEEIITFFIQFVVLYIIVNVAANYFINRSEQRARTKEEFVKKLDEKIRTVKIETYNGVDYWFDAENDRFLAQGSTRDEIVSVLKQRFTNYIFIVDHQLLAGPEFNPVSRDQITVTNLQL